MTERFDILTLVIGCLLAIYIGGCGADDMDDADMAPANNPPVVHKLIVPDEFSPGESIELEVIARDTDGDTLTYTWDVSAGKLDATTGSKVKWTAPSDVGSVTITVRVRDGENSSTTRSKTVRYVLEHLPDVQVTLIVPGKQAAGIKLGDAFKTVKALYGEPDEAVGKDGLFKYWDANVGLSGFLDDSHLVRSLFIRRPNQAKTAGGTRIGSSLKHVEGEFGAAEGVDKDAHWYWTKGIEFDYDAASRVEEIYVFPPIGAAPAKLAPLLTREQRRKVTADISLYRNLRRKAEVLSR